VKNITFIFPIKNEYKRINKIYYFINWCTLKKIKNFELFLIDNGSNKNSQNQTKKISKLLDKKNVKCFSLKKSSRGAAIKLGINNSKKKIIAICSIDNAWDLEFYQKGYDILKSNKIDIIYGPKDHSASSIKRPFFRVIISFFCTIFLKICFGNLIIEDTQCIKIFNKSKISFLKNISDVNFFHECEFYLLSKIYNLKTASIPVKVKDIKKTINVFYLIKFIFDATRFRFSKDYHRYKKTIL
jgi:hypothetical protein